MNKNETKKISKFLSLILRHKPEAVGVKLDENGWTDISTLLDRMNAAGTRIDRTELDYVVSTNEKKRFAISDCNRQIRASQGHSVEIDLDYTAKTPPEILFHGAPESVLPLIRKDGLKKMQRHHVHLNAAAQPCIHVAARYGKPVVIEIAAGKMFAEGFDFFLSANQVWLTDHVPPRYLSIPDSPQE